jgi:excisionase family DNA binding protein
MDKLAYRIPEAIQVSGLGRSTLYRQIADGRLKVRKCGAITLITRVDLEQFIEGLPTESGGEAE